MKKTFLLFIVFSFIVVGAQKGLMRSRDLMSMVTRKLANEDLEAACTLADSWCAFEGMGNGVMVRFSWELVETGNVKAWLDKPNLWFS